ncbi:MAG: prepilin peptidase [Actinobacteria bacterium]|nr:MAG: prepilin peptidase [Actinomycetota bacterium]
MPHDDRDAARARRRDEASARGRADHVGRGVRRRRRLHLERRIIPNRVVLPASAIVLLLNIAVHPSHALEWIVAAAASFAFFLAVALINPKGLGMGDVKLAFLIGAGLGWDVVAALILGTFAAAVYAVILVLTRPGASGKTAFALGPFLAGAAVVVLLLAH